MKNCHKQPGLPLRIPLLDALQMVIRAVFPDVATLLNLRANPQEMVRRMQACLREEFAVMTVSRNVRRAKARRISTETGSEARTFALLMFAFPAGFDGVHVVCLYAIAWLMGIDYAEARRLASKLNRGIADSELRTPRLYHCPSGASEDSEAGRFVFLRALNVEKLRDVRLSGLRIGSANVVDVLARAHLDFAELVGDGVKRYGAGMAKALRRGAIQKAAEQRQNMPQAESAAPLAEEA